MKVIDWYKEWKDGESDEDIYFIFTAIHYFLDPGTMENASKETIRALQKAVMAYFDNKDWKQEVRYVSPHRIRHIGNVSWDYHPYLGDYADGVDISKEESINWGDVDDDGNITITHEVKTVYKLERY